MANDAQPSVFDAAMTAWQDALAARARMPNLFLFAVVAIAVLNLIYFGLVVIGFLVGPGLLSLLIGLIYAVVEGLLLTPLAIAVHRFLLLNEAKDGYRIDTQDPRFMKFFTFLAGLSVVMLIPRLIGDLLSSPMGPTGFSEFITFILAIVAVVILVRNVILFPAVAVDAPGAEWRNAMADTKGHSWRVFFILLCVVLPPAILAMILLVIFFVIPFIGWIIGVAIQAAFAVLIVAATAAAASRLYAAYANQLGRPPGLPSAAPAGG
jgi:hypothetical protein